MADKKEPTDQSRRKFLKNISSGIVGAYAISPTIKANAENIKKDFLDSISAKVELNLSVNGKSIITKVNSSTTLAVLLREELNLTGTKIVCNQGECGSCTVLLNGDAVYSCHILALDAEGGEVTTVEGLLDGEELSEIQKSFVEKDGLQCGFCTPGQIMAGYAIISNKPEASIQEIKEGMSGNLCRCGAYPKIVDSIKSALNKKN